MLALSFNPDLENANPQTDSRSWVTVREGRRSVATAEQLCEKNQGELIYRDHGQLRSQRKGTALKALRGSPIEGGKRLRESSGDAAKVPIPPPPPPRWLQPAPPAHATWGEEAAPSRGVEPAVAMEGHTDAPIHLNMMVVEAAAVEVEVEAMAEEESVEPLCAEALMVLQQREKQEQMMEGLEEQKGAHHKESSQAPEAPDRVAVERVAAEREAAEREAAEREEAERFLEQFREPTAAQDEEATEREIERKREMRRLSEECEQVLQAMSPIHLAPILPPALGEEVASEEEASEEEASEEEASEEDTVPPLPRIAACRQGAAARLERLAEEVDQAEVEDAGREEAEQAGREEAGEAGEAGEEGTRRTAVERRPAEMQPMGGRGVGARRKSAPAVAHLRALQQQMCWVIGHPPSPSGHPPSPSGQAASSQWSLPPAAVESRTPRDEPPAAHVAATPALYPVRIPGLRSDPTGVPGLRQECKGRKGRPKLVVSLPAESEALLARPFGTDTTGTATGQQPSPPSATPQSAQSPQAEAAGAWRPHRRSCGRQQAGAGQATDAGQATVGQADAEERHEEERLKWVTRRGDEHVTNHVTNHTADHVTNHTADHMTNHTADHAAEAEAMGVQQGPSPPSAERQPRDQPRDQPSDQPSTGGAPRTLRRSSKAHLLYTSPHTPPHLSRARRRHSQLLQLPQLSGEEGQHASSWAKLQKASSVSFEMDSDARPRAADVASEVVEVCP